MSLRVNAICLGWLVVTWSTIQLGDLARAIPQPVANDELSALEDTFVTTPGDVALVSMLIGRYLERGEPERVILAMARVPTEARSEPELLHQLARAQARTGRVRAALDTAREVLRRCEQQRSCPVGERATLGVHVAALSRMVEWKVEDLRDPLALVAHTRAARVARIAPVGAGAY